MVIAVADSLDEHPSGTKERLNDIWQEKGTVSEFVIIMEMNLRFAGDASYDRTSVQRLRRQQTSPYPKSQCSWTRAPTNVIML